MTRNEEIDIMKGIAILSVVLFHSTPFRGVSLYMLPLFFLIAGYLMTDKTNIYVFLVNKTKRLLIPYLVWGCFFAGAGKCRYALCLFISLFI